MTNQRFVSVFKTDFFKSLAVLLSGTLIAQVISYALAPIISRIYSPAEMGDFGMFQRWVVLIATIATARYEFALPLPKKDQHSFLLYKFTVRIVIVTSLITLLCYTLYGIIQGEMELILMVSPLFALSVFFLAFMNLGSNWAIRHKQFRNLSFSKMANSMSLNFSRVILGWFGFGKFGLWLSFLLSLFVGALFFVKNFFHWNRKVEKKKQTKRMLVLAGIYREFPVSNLPHALSDNLRDVLVAVILVGIFSDELFGSFDHSFRILRIPVMVIGAVLYQVFFSKISNLQRENKPILKTVMHLFKLLFLASIIPFAILQFYGEELFIFIFGKNWALSGYLSEIMTPWLWLNFLVSPISVLPLVLGKQRSFFYIGLSSSLLQIVLFLLIPILLKNNSESIFWTFTSVSISQVLISCFTLYFFYSIAKENDKKYALE
jgi:O-antigen/teichoic acid export membrane protein